MSLVAVASVIALCGLGPVTVVVLGLSGVMLGPLGSGVLWAATPIFYGLLIGLVQLWALRSGLVRDRRVVLVLMALVGGAGAGATAFMLWLVGGQLGLLSAPASYLLFSAAVGALTGGMGALISSPLQLMLSGPRWLSWRWIVWNVITWSITWGMAWLIGSVLEFTALWFAGQPLAAGLVISGTGASLALFVRLNHQAEL